MEKYSDRLTIINLSVPWTECTICGAETVSHWSVPMWEGWIVDNDWPYDWGGVPACEQCYTEHSQGKHVEVTAAEFTCMA